MVSKSEPLITSAAIVGAVAALFAVFISFGIDISDAKQDSLLKAIPILWGLVSLYWGRKQVSAPDTVAKVAEEAHKLGVERMPLAVTPKAPTLSAALKAAGTTVVMMALLLGPLLASPAGTSAAPGAQAPTERQANGKGWARNCFAVSVVCITSPSTFVGGGGVVPVLQKAASQPQWFKCFKAYRNGARYGTYVERYLYYYGWRQYIWVESFWTDATSPAFCNQWSSINVAV